MFSHKAEDGRAARASEEGDGGYARGYGGIPSAHPLPRPLRPCAYPAEHVCAPPLLAPNIGPYRCPCPLVSITILIYAYIAAARRITICPGLARTRSTPWRSACTRSTSGEEPLSTGYRTIM